MNTIKNQLRIKSLDPLRAKKTFIRNKEDGPYHGSAIKASSVAIKNKFEPNKTTISLNVLTMFSHHTTGEVTGDVSNAN